MSTIVLKILVNYKNFSFKNFKMVKHIPLTETVALYYHQYRTSDGKILIPVTHISVCKHKEQASYSEI